MLLKLEYYKFQFNLKCLHSDYTYVESLKPYLCYAMCFKVNIIFINVDDHSPDLGRDTCLASEGFQRSISGPRPKKVVHHCLISTIRARQRNWMGHLPRGDSLQREIMEGGMEWKRGRGRPRQKLLDWMMSEGYGKLKEEAKNREKWSHRTSGPA